MSTLSPTLESIFNRPFGVFTLKQVTSYMMSRTNDTTRLSVASHISMDKFEMGRSDWSSVRTHAIKLYNKFRMVTYCSFIV